MNPLPTKRIYCGEDIARPLVVWLNKKRRTNSPEWKVIWLIEQLQTVVMLHETSNDRSYSVDLQRTEVALINKELRRYVFWLSVTLQEGGKIGIIRKSRLDHFEFLYAALCLAGNGYLLRLRRCNQCQRWLFARFSTQTVCSKVCRQKKHRANPTVRLRRSEYMRNYMRERRRVLPAKREKG